MASSVTIEKLADKMKLTNLLPNISMAGKKIVTSEINRPALQLTGYFDHFYSERRVYLSGASSEGGEASGI